MKVDITLISSTSYMECERLPIGELIDFHNRLVKQYNEIHKAK